KLLRKQYGPEVAKLLEQRDKDITPLENQLEALDRAVPQRLDEIEQNYNDLLEQAKAEGATEKEQQKILDDKETEKSDLENNAKMTKEQLEKKIAEAKDKWKNKLDPLLEKPTTEEVTDDDKGKKQEAPGPE